jgi:branched-chain amino acid aminotransferase
MINVSRGPLAMYKMVFDGKGEPTLVIADFPVKWTVAPLAHFFDDGVHAVTPSQPAIPAQLLEPKIKNRSRIHYMVANLQVSLLNDPNAWALLLDPDGFVAEGTGPTSLSQETTR